MGKENRRAYDQTVYVSFGIDLETLADEIRDSLRLDTAGNEDRYGSLLDFIRLLDAGVADEDFTKRLYQLVVTLCVEMGTPPQVLAQWDKEILRNR